MNKSNIGSAYATLDQVTLHYLDTRTEGDVIICLHGLWGRGETWKHFMSRYGDHYRVIAPDWRGHGYSDKPDTPYTAQVICDDIAQLMDHLGIENAIVLGHSQGGRIAAHLAFYHPEKVAKVGILDMSADGLDPNMAVDDASIKRSLFTYGWPETFESLEQARTFLRDKMESLMSYDHFMLSLTEKNSGYGMLFSQSAICSLKTNDTNWYHLLPEIKCPALLMRTSSHEAVPEADWNKMQAMLPNCTTAEMSDPDHNVHLANPEEFFDCIDKFINCICA